MTRILIVEDEAIIARDLQQTLQAMGYDVPEICSMGEAAIPAAERLRPDVVLMDVRLAGKMDGTEAARRIVAHHDAAIVFLTAFADDATLQRAAGSFPYGYLVKPYDERGLRAAIETALHRLEEDRRTKRRHTDALDQLDEGVMLFDGEGRLRYANLAARRAFPDVAVAEDLLGPDWQTPIDAEQRKIGGTSWRLSCKPTEGHYAVVVTGASEGHARAKKAMVELQERIRKLV